MLLSFVLLGLGACGSGGSAPAAHHEPALATLTPDDLEARLAANDGSLYVYDVNPREVYDDGHVPGARWAPFAAITADLLPPDKGATLVFYCANEH